MIGLGYGYGRYVVSIVRDGATPVSTIRTDDLWEAEMERLNGGDDVVIWDTERGRFVEREEQ